MDRNGDSLSYLKYFRDKSQSLFMQNTDECLEMQDPSLQEPMFTEIDEVSEWPAEGYPVLYGSLITEDTDEQVELEGGVEISETAEDAEELQDYSNLEQGEDNSTISEPVVSGKGLMTTDGLFVSNELLLNLDLQNINSTDETAAEQSSDVTNANYEPSDNHHRSEELNWNDFGDVVQMLNNGSIITVNKSLFNTVAVAAPDGKVETTYDKLFETVSALKCKLCSFLSEEQQRMIEHMKNEHIPKVAQNGEYCTKTERSKPIIKTVEMKSILNINRNKETKQTVYLCSECNMGYANKNLLKEHMIAKHNLVNHSEMNAQKSQQPETGVKIKNLGEALVNLVLKQYKASKKIKCSFKGCELKFPRDDARMTHEKCHDSEQKKQYKCIQCEEKFVVWRMCSSHLWKCHNIDTGLLSCPKCKFKSASFSRMKVHIAIHDEEHPFVCHECGKSFKQCSQLKNHQVVHKNPELDDIPEWAIQKQCDMCKKYFANSKSLKKHVQIVHDKFKPFICNICGHKTARKSMLDLHLRQHTGEKPHQCPICVYKTGDPNCLRRHIMRHEGETKYSCPHCDYQSIQSTSYKNHIATKHPGKGGTFYCSTCSYHTVSETAFYNHKREHKKNTNGKLDAAQNCNMDVSDSVAKTNGVPRQSLEMEDDETQNLFLNTDVSDETIDTGGITIPAGFELQVSL